MSQDDQEDYEAFYRPARQKILEATAIKRGEELEVFADREKEKKPELVISLNLAKELDSVEQEIAEIQEQLADIKQRKSKLNEETEDFILLEDERKILRKNLIDLDSTHKGIHKAYKKQNQEKIKAQQAEKQKKLKEEHSQKITEIEKQEQEQAQQQTGRTNQEPKQETSQPKQQEAPEEQAPQKTENIDAEIKTYEEKLIEARHRARVAAIEAELASQRLQRSRQIELQVQIIRLRTEYPPYSWWSHYPLSYRFYPYDVPLYPSSLRYSYLSPHYPFYPLGRYYRYYPYI